MSDRDPGSESDPFPEALAPEPPESPRSEPPGSPSGAADSPAASPPVVPAPAPPPVAAPPLAPYTPASSSPPGWPAGYRGPAPAAPAALAPPAVAGPPPGPYPLLPEPAPRIGYAGFWIRFVAWLLDVIVLWILSFGTHAVIRLSAGVPVFPLWTFRGASGPPALSCAEMLVGVAVTWLYHALFESSASQATLGKQALRLRVTDMNGRRISFARATGRHFAKIVSVLTLGVGFVMIAFTGRRQGLHDMMAETVVLRERS